MDRREEILTAASHAFLKFGIEKITLDDIAREIGIQKTALYYYFKNKEQLIAEMISQKINDFQQKMAEAVLKEGNVRDKLRTFMKTKINLMKDNLPFMKLFDKEGLSKHAQQFLANHRQMVLENDFCLIKEIIQQGISNHRISFQLNDSLVLMILGVTYGSFIGRFIENANWDIEDMIETSIEVIFKGIE
jgi:AcrR family transcriptional regulator